MLDIVIGLLPLVCLGLLVAGCHRREPALLEAVVVGALGWGLAAVICLELLGVVGEINRFSVIVFWSLVSVGVILNLIVQRQNRFIRVKKIDTGRDAEVHAEVGDPLYLILAASAAVIVAITTTVALISAPNNWDSLNYHLPRIEQWIQQGSLAHFPTETIRQLASNPAAEMLILHFRILAGSDRLDNLVQALAFAGSIATSALVARRLGASRNGQILAALYTATLPIAILEGSSTQTDLVVSFFLLAAFERLLAWRSSGRIVSSIGIGAALGLAILAASRLQPIGGASRTDHRGDMRFYLVARTQPARRRQGRRRCRTIARSPRFSYRRGQAARLSQSKRHRSLAGLHQVAVPTQISLRSRFDRLARRRGSRGSERTRSRRACCSTSE